ncbi:hypothetical protein QBZ16_002458 [Prototheca wickerhamii]|uniref:Uncharacterized protein n=1 Tax=Prototheca wickerhamii TaxID=3111 RepID=A0AAD9INX2_PROWI|nr:hypothetical protein QBZ16_002458 [Prototheca wickerhamii]
MEATAEGLAKAAATREALKAKKRELEKDAEVQEVPEAKRQATGKPSAPCTHEVLFPKDYDRAAAEKELDPDVYGTFEAPAYTGPAAKEYPFTLDTFQAIAVACVERNENVLVAAHTSAGKTAIAEYAIAKAFSKKQRVFYTSPIKALSNQKFRELSEEFGDVGLMTGDVSINPNAACIVMTTEILRSMIYRGSELLRETAWIIFDEVHYMQDRERGVIWEETIIFAPKEARMVFLSATLSNANEFADWVASVHHSPCHVVYTEFRPTPLRHYAYPSGGEGLYLILNEFGEFRQDNFRKLQASLAGEEGGGAKKSRKKTDADRAGGLRKIVRLIKERHFDPVIVFSFSRRECESNAMLMADEKLGRLDFNSEAEKEAVDVVFKNAIECLPQRDRELRAVVEVLFQEQLIKCLFATETFAMGLNMPARTVVFTAMRKWDGREERWVGSGEYIQMSGRAGRRGKDDRGMTIMMLDKKLDEETCRAIIRGKANPLVSSFRLSYYTLLNLFRRGEQEGADMEYVIRHSFSQFQHEKELPALERRLAELEAEAEALGRASEGVVEAYRAGTERLEALDAALAAEIRRPERCLHFLRPGRLVRVRQGATDWGWGVVVSVLRVDRGMRREGEAAPGAGDASAYQMDVLLCCAGARDGQPVPARPEDEGAAMEVVPAPLATLRAISTLRISILQDLRPPEARAAVLTTVRALCARYRDGELPLLDPVEDLRVQDPAVAEALAERAALLAELGRNALFQAARARPRTRPRWSRCAGARRW